VVKRLRRGMVVQELLKQPNNAPVPMEDQVICLYAFREGFFEGCPPDEVQSRMRDLTRRIRTSNPGVVEALVKSRDLTVEVMEGLKHEFARFRNTAV